MYLNCTSKYWTLTEIEYKYLTVTTLVFWKVLYSKVDDIWLACQFIWLNQYDFAAVMHVVLRWQLIISIMVSVPPAEYNILWYGVEFLGKILSIRVIGNVSGGTIEFIAQHASPPCFWISIVLSDHHSVRPLTRFKKRLYYSWLIKKTESVE